MTDPFSRAVEFRLALSNAILRARVLEEDARWQDLPDWSVISGEGLDLEVLRPLVLVALVKHPVHGIWAVGLMRAGGAEVLVQMQAEPSGPRTSSRQEA